ncbi:MAG: hypothetical protein WCP92_04900 [bacterium]
MTSIDKATLDTHFANEKKEITDKKELFSDADLKEFNTLVKDDTDFQILLKGLTSTTILTDINNETVSGKKDGLKTTIDTEIGKTINKDQSTIFNMEYNKLTPVQMDLYEVCVL